MSFSKRLAELRHDHGMTQRELADKIGVSRGTIGMYEISKRDPDTDTLVKIARVFNVTTDYLLGNTDLVKESVSNKDFYISEDYAEKYNVTKKDLTEYKNFIKYAGTLFMNDQVAEEDKEALFKDISNMFWESKEINKKKYGRKKKK